MNTRPTIQIPAPKFDLYQLVIVYWNDQEHVTQTVRRWLDFDDGDGCWWYKVQGLEQLFPEDVIGPRNI